MLARQDRGRRPPGLGRRRRRALLTPPGADPGGRALPHLAQLAEAIDDAFTRWDRAHPCQFDLADGARIALPDPDFDEPGETLDYRRLRLSRLEADEQFVYAFDLGDDWAHLCTVGPRRIDPAETLGIVPTAPLPYWGWDRFLTSTGGASTATTASRPSPTTPACRPAVPAPALGTRWPFPAR